MTDCKVARDGELNEDADEQSSSSPRSRSRATHEDAEDDTAHLDELPDGSGCTEIWEHLSERRSEARDPEDPKDESEDD